MLTSSPLISSITIPNSRSGRDDVSTAYGTWPSQSHVFQIRYVSWTLSKINGVRKMFFQILLFLLTESTNFISLEIKDVKTIWVFNIYWDLGKSRENSRHKRTNCNGQISLVQPDCHVFSTRILPQIFINPLVMPTWDFWRLLRRTCDTDISLVQWFELVHCKNSITNTRHLRGRWRVLEILLSIVLKIPRKKSGSIFLTFLIDLRDRFSMCH